MGIKNEVIIMKKVLLFFLLFNFMLAGNVFAQESNINVYIYGEKVSFPNTPLIINDHTFVPMRSIFEYLGSSIDWDANTMSIIAKRGNIEIKLVIGSKDSYVNGNYSMLSDEPRLINGNTYVPLRFISEAFNQDVKWDSSTNTISIGKELQPKDISEIVSPAVVYIEIYDKNNKPIKSGSGFIVDKSGIVVTNFHVIDLASKAIIKLIDGRTFETHTVIGYNKDRDIAVLKIESNNLPTVSIGNSDDVDNGDKVVTIGSPLGLENSISDGLVSNNNRKIEELKYIQISAAISHGSSGGALIDEKNAKVIGITTLGFVDGQNINMAIPINDYKNLYISNAYTMDDVYQFTHVIKYANGDYYEGDIKKGILEGQGFYKWANGDNYYGDWINNVRTGKGICFWANGDEYQGDFVNSKFEGTGKLTLKNGFTYEGDYLNDQRNGNGKSSWSNGDMYIGSWKDNERTGYGTYYFANGQTLKGNFLNGQFIN